CVYIYRRVSFFFCCFFFQAEDGIRDKLVTGVQTCALPISDVLEKPEGLYGEFEARFPYPETDDQLNAIEDVLQDLTKGQPMDRRSEERRVGKEGRSGWSQYHYKKKHW